MDKNGKVHKNIVEKCENYIKYIRFEKVSKKLDGVKMTDNI